MDVIRYCALAGLILLATSPESLAASPAATWRVPIYGEEPSGGPLPRQALEFAGNGDVYALQYAVNLGTPGVRLRRVSATDGGTNWFRDLPVSASKGGTISIAGTAAMAVDGEDAIVASTDEGDNYFGRVARYRGSDGATVWQAEQHGADDMTWTAVAVDGSGDVLAAGGTGHLYDKPLAGRVTKFSGATGSPLWTFDISAADCGVGTPSTFEFASVGADGDGDVIAAGAAVFEAAIPACIVKLDAADGHLLWSSTYGPSGASILMQLQIDDAGNPVLGFQYWFGGSGFSVAKFSGSSGQKQWSDDAVTIGGQKTIAASIAVAQNGNVMVSSNGTRSYASDDGQLVWPADASFGGSATVESTGDVLVARLSGGNRETARLAAGSGQLLWSKSEPLPVSANWESRAAIAARGTHFVALQVEQQTCCVEKQTLLALAATADGIENWLSIDRIIASSHAAQFKPNPVFSRTTARLPGGDIVTVGTAYLGYVSSANSVSARIIATRRSFVDGRTVWQTAIDVGVDDCVPSALVVDGNGDVIVGGTCGAFGLTTKLFGATGAVAWTGSAHDTCDYTAVQAVAVDAANDVYATGWCESSSPGAQLTVKYAGTTGHPDWQKQTGGALSGDSQALVVTDAAGNVVIGGPIGAYGATGVIVRKLDPATGSISWSRQLDPPQDGYQGLAGMVAYANGDIAIAAIESVLASSPLVVRLAEADGGIKWANHDSGPDMVAHWPVALALDGLGNVHVAGPGGAWKYAAANGARSWTLHGLPPGILAVSFNDVIVAPDGSIAYAGSCPMDGSSVTTFCVIDADAASGVPIWTFVDSPEDPGFSDAIGLVPSGDGGFIVSADFDLPDVVQWEIVRIAAPASDRLLANGFEP